MSLKLTAGDRLGSYEIIAPLGAGGMGEVYRARDVRLDREVAIKVLPESLTFDADHLNRFEQEARAAASLNHPNILAVHQMATHDGSSYIVSELLEGETLRQRLWRGSLSISKAINYAVQLAHGLAAAHEKGIVHRDLKPENLFITKDGRLKILDFGLAKVIGPEPTEVQAPGFEHALTSHTMPGVVLGTSGYMSPEQVRRQAIDPRSDIFAFGAILHEMITGKRAFEGQTPADTMVAILNEDPNSISQSLGHAPLALQKFVQRCLEKDPERRFQSASDLAFALEALSESRLSSANVGAPTMLQAGKRTRVMVAVLIGLLAVSVLGFWLLRDSPVPAASDYVQLTHDGQPKSLLGTDGARLYLGLGPYPFQAAAEMPVAGGEPRKIPMPSPHAIPIVLSPDGSDLLVVDGEGVPPSGQMWRLPLAGGSPRTLGDVVGETGAWSPDGKMLAFTKLSELFVANSDGSGSRKLATVQGDINSVVWSPEADRVRLDSSETVAQHQLWEVSLDAKDVRRLLAGWHNPPDECCGRWTTNGKYFLFQSRGQIWVLPKPRFMASDPKPIQLTSSPMSLSSPVPGKDGKTIFVVGQVNRGELRRYDLNSGQFSPFLGGISAEYLDFSKDGQWVAYVSYPEGMLWRSKVDGSERLQLTYPPMYPMLPRWAPDGKSIVFFEFSRNGKPARIYEISAQGGNPHELLPSDPGQQVDPNWSPDGTKIVFGGNSTDTGSIIRLFQVKSGNLSELPRSQGLFSPRWSPDGRYICALSADSARLLIFDFRTEKWTEVATGSFGWLNWSNDGKYVYVLDQGGNGTVLRVRVQDRKVEKIVELTNFKTTGRYRGALALSLDNSPLLLEDAGTQDVYAVHWQGP